MLWTCWVHCDWHIFNLLFWALGDWIHWDGEPWRCNNTPHTHIFSSTKLPTRVTVADKLVLVNPFWWNNHLFIVKCAVYSLFSSWFIQRASLTVNIDLSDVTNKYYTVLYRKVVVYEKKNRSLVFSGSRKIPTLWSTIQWETRQASFPTGTVGPWVGIFCPHWTPMMDSIDLTYLYQPVETIKIECRSVTSL